MVTVAPTRGFPLLSSTSPVIIPVEEARENDARRGIRITVHFTWTSSIQTMVLSDFCSEESIANQLQCILEHRVCPGGKISRSCLNEYIRSHSVSFQPVTIAQIDRGLRYPYMDI